MTTRVEATQEGLVETRRQAPSASSVREACVVRDVDIFCQGTDGWREADVVNWLTQLRQGRREPTYVRYKESCVDLSRQCVCRQKGSCFKSRVRVRRRELELVLQRRRTDQESREEIRDCVQRSGERMNSVRVISSKEVDRVGEEFNVMKSDECMKEFSECCSVMKFNKIAPRIETDGDLFLQSVGCVS